MSGGRVGQLEVGRDEVGPIVDPLRGEYLSVRPAVGHPILDESAALPPLLVEFPVQRLSRRPIAGDAGAGARLVFPTLRGEHR